MLQYRMPTSSVDPVDIGAGQAVGPFENAESRTGVARDEGALLYTVGLDAGYSEVPVIRGINLSVAAGQVVVVVGPNGSGKSTLIKALLGVVRVLNGTVMFNGRDVTHTALDRLCRSGVGYVPQVNDVFANLRVFENLEMGGYLLDPVTRARRVEEVIEIFPPLRRAFKRYVRSMSGGEQKMVAIARALMPSPRVLVLDEPTAGLSPELTRVVLDEQIGALADRGTAILLVEQKAKLALRLADRAYVMVRGEIVKADTASNVLDDPRMAEIFLGGGSVSEVSGAE